MSTPTVDRFFLLVQKNKPPMDAEVERIEDAGAAALKKPKAKRDTDWFTWSEAEKKTCAQKYRVHGLKYLKKLFKAVVSLRRHGCIIDRETLLVMASEASQASGSQDRAFPMSLSWSKGFRCVLLFFFANDRFFDRASQASMGHWSPSQAHDRLFVHRRGNSLPFKNHKKRKMKYLKLHWGRSSRVRCGECGRGGLLFVTYFYFRMKMWKKCLNYSPTTKMTLSQMTLKRSRT